MGHRASLSAAEGEIERIEARREELRPDSRRRTSRPPATSRMADLYRQKVTTTGSGPGAFREAHGAAEAVRGLTDAIVLSPKEGELQST